MGTFRTTAEYNYQALRSNVDLLKLIQLGLTFSDEHGNLCPGTCTWQFNFKFNLGVDMYSQSSIELLSNSGVDFDKLSQHGINYAAFGEALMMSGEMVAGVWEGVSGSPISKRGLVERVTSEVALIT